ncbi:MAG TPA: ribokinase, partial [Aliiroseovarius sp.]|nr:ribokinase [Aliiroseovarius sp.]
AIVTLGNAGSLFFDGRAAHHIAPVDAGPVVETTGAGDCFNGAFAAALARGMPPLGAAHFASAAAAISVTRPGTAGAMPAFEEIRALIGA